MKETLKKIFEDILKIDNLTDFDKSFLDLGGQSLDAMKIQISIKKEIGKRVSINEIYELGSINKIAGRLI